jgi:AbiV family abortive infection protein
LLEFWRESQKTGTSPTVKDIQRAFENHTDKQQAAVLSWTIQAEGGTAIDKAIRTQLNRSATDAERKQAEQVMESALRAFQRRAPGDRHETRMQAFYVDLDDSGTWKLPERITRREASKLLNDALNDYVVQRERMVSLSELRAFGEPGLADELEAWPDRPDLPEPVRPELIV